MTAITRTLALSVALLLGGGNTLEAQDPTPDQDAFRAHFQEALDALRTENLAGYASHLEQALPLLGRGHINRPFVQYHLARAAAMAGDSVAAARWLATMLAERIEGLMLYYSAYDSAFATVRETRPFKAVFRQVDTLSVTATHVQGNVYVLEGAGCQIAAQVGRDGILLVDAGYALGAPAVVRALSKLSKAPVRYLINTHSHEDHVGGNATLGAQAAVIAHPTTRDALMKPQPFIDGVVVPPHTGRSLPTLMVSSPIEIEFNGETIRIVPFPGHTEGDLIVSFEESNVVHVGDRYFPGASPYIAPADDVTAHLARVDSLVQEMTAETKVISGHGPVTPAAQFNAAHQATIELVEFVRMGMRAKKTLDQVKMDGKARGFPERWVEGIYRALQEEQ